MSVSLSSLAIALMTGLLRSPALNALSCFTIYPSGCPTRRGVSPVGATAMWQAWQARLLALPAAASPPAFAMSGKPSEIASTTKLPKLVERIPDSWDANHDTRIASRRSTRVRPRVEHREHLDAVVGPAR